MQTGASWGVARTSQRPAAELGDRRGSDWRRAGPGESDSILCVSVLFFFNRMLLPLAGVPFEDVWVAVL